MKKKKLFLSPLIFITLAIILSIFTSCPQKQDKVNFYNIVFDTNQMYGKETLDGLQKQTVDGIDQLSINDEIECPVKGKFNENGTEKNEYLTDGSRFIFYGWTANENYKEIYNNIEGKSKEELERDRHIVFGKTTKVKDVKKFANNDTITFYAMWLPDSMYFLDEGLDEDFSPSDASGKEAVHHAIKINRELIGDTTTIPYLSISGFRDGHNLDAIADNAFYGYNFSEIVIANSSREFEGFKYIGANAFSGNKTNYSDNKDLGAFFEISLPDTLEKISPCTFNDAHELQTIKVNSENRNFSSNNGVLFNYSTKTILYRYPQSGLFEEVYSIPQTVEHINQYAFYGCKKLNLITIPLSVTAIDSHAFDDCTSLEEIRYNGTMEEWGRITICGDVVEQEQSTTTWHNRVPCTKITCTDGDVNL